jgi:uncharacterized protein YwqG
MNSHADPLFRSLRQRIDTDAELPRLDLQSLARPSVRLATQRVPYARFETGASRIGGVPDVPRGFEWPRWAPAKPRDDKFGRAWRPEGLAPLGFIAQIDLAAIPQIDDLLPDSGWLYFFYDRYCEPWGFDPADRGCCRVMYSDAARTALIRADAPDDADPEHIEYPCQVEAWPELTLPDCPPDLEYGTAAYAAYHKLHDELIGAGGSAHHRLLGHPQVIQNPMELECQLDSHGVYCGGPAGYKSDQAKSLKAGAADWRLLLQIDSDEEGPGWMWGDVGRIYFWIKKQDLRALRFDDVWLIFQCY